MKSSAGALPSVPSLIGYLTISNKFDSNRNREWIPINYRFAGIQVGPEGNSSRHMRCADRELARQSAGKNKE
jgi:hypothetical protein